MGIPDEVRKLIEQHKGTTTFYSTNITVETVPEKLETCTLSAKTENGQTTITHNGRPVFAGPTTGPISTFSMNENGQEYAAALDGDKVLWENTPGAAEHFKK